MKFGKRNRCPLKDMRRGKIPTAYERNDSKKDGIMHSVKHHKKTETGFTQAGGTKLRHTEKEDQQKCTENPKMHSFIPTRQRIALRYNQVVMRNVGNWDPDALLVGCKMI